MNILAIDPGSSRSGWVLLDGERVSEHGLDDNEMVVARLRAATGPCTVVLENIEPRQQPLGREVADTLRWIGRFMEAARPLPVHLVTRRAVTTHHIDGGTKDADKRIRARLLDRYGEGSNRKGGALYGITHDRWSALAIGLFWTDLYQEEETR